MPDLLTAWMTSRLRVHLSSGRPCISRQAALRWGSMPGMRACASSICITEPAPRTAPRRAGRSRTASDARRVGTRV